MAKTETKNVLGIFISPKEICIAQIRTGKDLRPEPEHLVKFPTGFAVKEGMLRPLSLNNDFFSEKASWIEPFNQAVKQVNWGSSVVVVSLAPQFAILRYFVMPSVARKFWSKSIPLESKKYIPVSFDEVVYDFDVTPIDAGKKLGVLFGLTQRKSVEFLINTLKAAGLDLIGLEISPSSLERLFGVIDAKDHESKGYIHFSGNSNYMMFSHGGFPVLYRESEGDSSGSMSERKRLDVKGAVQYVDRYLGAGVKYQNIRLSGDGAEAWKLIAEKEAENIPVTTWNPAGDCAVKDGSVSALFAIGAALRNRVTVNSSLDISGISSAAKTEKTVLNYVRTLTIVIGGILLLLSTIGQARLSGLNSQLSSYKNKISSVPELVGKDAETMRKTIDTTRITGRILQAVFTKPDYLAPKLGAIADNIPRGLWLASIVWENPLQISDRQSNDRALTLKGETFLLKEQKTSVTEMFLKALKVAPEFASFTAPNGAMDLVVESAMGNKSFQSQEGLRSGQFQILAYGRKK